MSDIGISLASLVKSNNGKFKSEKQAQFLSSKADRDVVIVGDICYGHSYFTEYHLDTEGVLKVVRLNKAGRKVMWERAGSVAIPIQVTKELNRLKRMHKEVSLRVQETQAAIDMNEVFRVSMAALQQSRLSQLREIEERIADVHMTHLV
jgi:uncharacterized Ntn-hydrolase superfamily protein